MNSRLFFVMQQKAVRQTSVRNTLIGFVMVYKNWKEKYRQFALQWIEKYLRQIPCLGEGRFFTVSVCGVGKTSGTQIQYICLAASCRSLCTLYYLSNFIWSDAATDCGNTCKVWNARAFRLQHMCLQNSSFSAVSPSVSHMHIKAVFSSLISYSVL